MSNVQCDACPHVEGCETCAEVKLNDDSCSVETNEFDGGSSVENPQSFDAQSNDFVETPAIVTAINVLGESAQRIHETAKTLHPGDAGIFVGLAHQLGAVAQMFIQAVEAVNTESDSE